MLNNGSLFAANLIPVHTINSEWCQWRNAITAHPILGEMIDGESTAEKIIKAVDQFKVSLQGEKPMSIRLSGGKDSTTVVVLFMLAIMELKESGAFIVPRQVIASSDTRSENVEVSRLLNNAHRALKTFCKEHELPVTMIIAQPRLGQTMIGRIVTGRGLPSYPTKDAQCATMRG